MVRDNEQKTIAEMTDLMVKVLRENGINPMQSMTLVGYAARQVITDISRSICISPEMGVIVALGGMLPDGYLREMCNNQLPAGGCCK